jgi:hypothetical protein
MVKQLAEQRQWEARMAEAQAAEAKLAEERAAKARQLAEQAATGQLPPVTWGTKNAKRIEIERLRREIEARKKR